MPQARDEAGNVWEVDAQGNPVRLLQAARPQGPQSVTIGTPNQTKVAKDQAELNSSVLSAQGKSIDNRVSGATADAQITKAGRDAATAGLPNGYMWGPNGTAIPIPGTTTQAQNDIGNASKLRSDYDALAPVKEYRAAVPNFMAGLKASPDATGDNSLLYAYAKVMDPGSVVRESEMSMGASGASYWDNAVAALKKQLGLEGGGQLTPDVRDRLKRDMQTKVQQMGEIYRLQRNRFSQDAQAFGVDPARVVGPDDFAPYVKEWEKLSGQRGDGKSAPVAAPTPWNTNFDQNGGNPTDLAPSGAQTKSIPIPPQMQQEFSDYVAQRAGKLNPQEYAAFRNQLAQKYGFGTSPDTTRRYIDEANNLNRDARAGRTLNLGIPPAEAKMSALDRVNNAMFNNPVGAAAMSFGSLGGAADEVFGYGKSLFTGTDPNVEIAKADAIRQTMGEQYPVATLAGNVAGALTTGYAMGGLPLLSGATETGLGTLATGAGYGALSGAAENNDNRMWGSALGGGLGMFGAGVSRVFAPALDNIARSSFAQKTAQAVANLRGKPFTPAPMLTPAESAIYGMKPDVSGAVDNLHSAGELGLPFSLADADPRLRALSGTVTRRSPEARAFAEGVLNPRDLGQADRAVSAIDQYLAPRTDISARSAQIINEGKPVYQPLYERAYAAPPVSSPGIDSVLMTPSGRGATARAERIAADEFRDPKGMGFAVDASGNVVLNPAPVEKMMRLDSARQAWDDAKKAYDQAIAARQASLSPGSMSKAVRDAETKLNMASSELDAAKSDFLKTPRGGSVADNQAYTTQSLDYVKRGLDDILETQRNPVTGKLDLNEAGRATNGVRAKLLSELDAVNPAYKDARGAYERFAKQAEALDTGRSLASGTVPLSDFQTVLDRHGAYDANLPTGWEGTSTMPELRRGYASAIADTVDNARLSANPYNSIYGSTAQQQKVASLFPQGADKFGRQYSLEDMMRGTRQEVMGGSPTAQRLQADQAIGSDALMTALDAGSQLATGGGLSLGSAISLGKRMLSDKARLGLGKAAEQRAAQMAPMLFDTSNPSLMADALDELSRKFGTIDARRAALARQGGMFGATAFPSVTLGTQF